MEKAQNEKFEKLNEKIRLSKDVLNLKQVTSYRFTLYPTDFILKHLGYIKSFDEVAIDVELTPNNYTVDCYVKIEGDFEVFEINSADTFNEFYSLEDNFVISNDDDVSDFASLDNKSFDLLGVVLALLYDLDSQIYLDDVSDEEVEDDLE